MSGIIDPISFLSHTAVLYVLFGVTALIKKGVVCPEAPKNTQKIRTKVNIMKPILKSIFITIFATSFVVLPNVASAQAKKGAQLQKELIAVKTVADVETLSTGDSFAMACAKCKTIWVAEVKKNAKGAELLKAKGKPTKLVGKHQCEGCGGTVEITGHGKGKEATLVHTCSSCGDDSAFCCATKKPSSPTKGMEKKK